MAKGVALTIGLTSVDPKHYQGWSGELAACEADAKDLTDPGNKSARSIYLSSIFLDKRARVDPTRPSLAYSCRAPRTRRPGSSSSASRSAPARRRGSPAECGSWCRSGMRSGDGGICSLREHRPRAGRSSGGGTGASPLPYGARPRPSQRLALGTVWQGRRIRLAERRMPSGRGWRMEQRAATGSREDGS